MLIVCVYVYNEEKGLLDKSLIQQNEPSSFPFYRTFLF